MGWNVLGHVRLGVLYHFNSLRMDSLEMVTSSLHELLGVVLLPLCEVYVDASPSFPTSMHS